MADFFVAHKDVLLEILKYGITFVIGAIAIGIIGLILKNILKKSRIDPAAHKFLLDAAKIVLWVILIVIIISMTKIPTAPLVTVLGVAVGAIGLSLKEYLANVAGGLIIMITNPFSKDDYVTINDTDGLVQDINIMTTSMKTYDYKIVTMPNSMVTSAVITNHSRSELRRVDMRVTLKYSTDIQKTRELFEALCDCGPMLLKDPPCRVDVDHYDSAGIVVDYRVWCKSEDYWDAYYFVEENLKTAFQEAGIRFPHETIDVHIKKKWS